jgi:vacuolar protein sorting-associated protein 8
VAVQWLSRSVLGILTISQRLVILEDITLRVTDSFDLIQKHIYHHDIFSTQLRSAVENLDDDDEALHGVVADAFHMSFRSYKGRIFLLGFNDISIGTLSNWADRLTALLEGGDCVSAIKLAEAYYTGEADKITVGLPDDDKMRHSIVRDKLIEILTASLKYSLTRENAPVHEAQEDREKMVEDLCSASFSASLAVGNLDLLFGEVFAAFEAGSFESVYFQTLEPYILSEEITSVPTEILQHLVMQYNSEDKAARLETIICHLDPQLMDIHQVTTLCKQFHLYDGLIHVWNQAIGDYVTPLIELLKLHKEIVHGDADESEKLSDSASKIFPYLAHILTGRHYPGGMEMDDADASRAKSDLYGFLFSATATPWPAGSAPTFMTADPPSKEPSYPYLHLILRYDAASFLSMIHEAFEDQFLNGVSQANGSNEATNGIKHNRHLPTRQMIIGILLEVLGEKDFGVEDTIYLDMFIARNLPKFPQFIVLPGHILDKILRRLCLYPSNELADDCQLSVEYLLSYYHPSDITKLTHEFHEAGFFRVLKSMYRSAKSYGPLMETYFEDLKDREAVFDCIGDCLRPGAPLTSKQVREVHSVIQKHAQELVNINTPKAAKTLYTYAPQLLDPVLEALDEGSYARFAFLKTLLDSDFSSDDEIHHKFDEQYVQLMCAYEPVRVASYIDILQSGDLRLQKVLPAIEKSGAIDAAVVLLSRDGLIEDAMERLRSHMLTLGGGLTGLISTVTHSPDVRSTAEGVEDLLLDVHKYVKVGIWLCQGQTKLASESTTRPKQKSKGMGLRALEAEKDLALDELLWLDLIDTTVRITKDVSAVSTDLAIPEEFAPTMSKINLSLRSAVQECFTALLSATTRPSPPAITAMALPAKQPHPTFLTILRAFLTRASTTSASLAELRTVLADTFQAHAFEERILRLAHHFLDKDLFARVESAWESRQHGWRPGGSNACERCARRVWGPGAGAGVWEAWEARNDARERETVARRRGARARAEEKADGGASAMVARGRGKGKALDAAAAAATTVDATGRDETEARAVGPAEAAAEEGSVAKEVASPLLVFACRHVWHRDCLERAMAENGVSRGRGGKEFVCQASHGES